MNWGYNYNDKWLLDKWLLDKWLLDKWLLDKWLEHRDSTSSEYRISSLVLDLYSLRLKILYVTNTMYNEGAFSQRWISPMALASCWLSASPRSHLLLPPSPLPRVQARRAWMAVILIVNLTNCNISRDCNCEKYDFRNGKNRKTSSPVPSLFSLVDQHHRFGVLYHR